MNGNIAPLGFTMRGDLTPWVIGPIVVGLLAMIRNCRRGVLECEEHALDEPWLVDWLDRARAVGEQRQHLCRICVARLRGRFDDDGRHGCDADRRRRKIALRAARNERRDAEARRVEAVAAN
jgi:hypothetical protein